MKREHVTAVALGCLLVLSQMFAMLLAVPFKALEVRAFDNPEQAQNALIYLLMILGFTAVILLLIKFRRENVMKYLILGSIFFVVFFVFWIPFWILLFPVPEGPREIAALVCTLAFAVGLVYALIRKPEWYVVNAAGLTMAVGVTAILGLSFAPLPVFLLLIAVAVYDAISVYWTKHMITLADSVTEQRLPVLLVVPKSLDYSFQTQKRLKDQLDEGGEREAMFMGLGDLIFPGIVAISAFSFLPTGGCWAGFGCNAFVALGGLLGSLVGFVFLMRYVLRGRPQAGLPLLNGGALAGYLVAYAITFHEFSFGFSLVI